MSSGNVIVDYGVGNILSVYRAFRHCGADIRLADNAAEIRDADRIVLPGVGAFSACVSALKESELLEPVADFVATGRPMLGICVGMQLLFDASHEFGHHQGLGIIDGVVSGLPTATTAGERLKVPHVGWGPLNVPAGSASDVWSNGILQGVAPGSHVYFVHSFGCVPDNPEHRMADTRYGGHDISAVVRAGNVTGCQFHPEKSGPTGLRMIENFLRQ